MINDKYIKNAKLSDDIHLLGNTLGKVIRKQSGIETYEIVERIRALCKAFRNDSDNNGIKEQIYKVVENLDIETIAKIARAYTLYFDLVNIAEEIERLRAIRARENELYPQPIEDSIHSALLTLKELGVESEEVRGIINNLEIEPVFTAHPTETKRRTVQSQIRRIAESVYKMETSNLSRYEFDQLKEEIYSEITLMWITNRNRTSKPDVRDEVRTGLYYFDTVIWNLIPKIYRKLGKALEQYYPEVEPNTKFLHFSSWIGGDRDGNPNVTPEVTTNTLLRHRYRAALKLSEAAGNINRHLSISSRKVELTKELKDYVQDLIDHPNNRVLNLHQRYPQEPFRLIGSVLADKLSTSARMMAAMISPNPTGLEYKSEITNLEEIRKPISLIQESLYQNNIEAVAEHHFNSFAVQSEVFGLHIAALDIRQVSTLHESVLDEILRGLKICDNYADLDESGKMEILDSELSKKSIPDINSIKDLSDETLEQINLLKEISRHINKYGKDSIGSYVISMSSEVSDILEIMLLAKWYRLVLNGEEKINFCPLFETREDLRNAPKVLRELFNQETYKKHLNARQRKQMLMVGYSDSNKDAGFLTARWEIYLAQKNIAQLCREENINFTIFHGRGGTIARGGGPTNESILAMPNESINGRIRLTEQGEMLEERFGNPYIAERYLEQMINSVLLNSSDKTQEYLHNSTNENYFRIMNELSETASKKYRGLVYETPEFIEFWQQATPISEVNKLKISSRPAKRKMGGGLASLRAIPWGFSWMQARFVLPAWFGLGSAIYDYIHKEQHGIEERKSELTAMYEDWRFFRMLIDNAQFSLSQADKQIATIYSELVENENVREKIGRIIFDEFDLTKDMSLIISKQNELLERKPIIKNSIKLRNPYVDALNFLQTTLLKKLRATNTVEENEKISETIFLTINGIASGLKNTG